MGRLIDEDDVIKEIAISTYNLIDEDDNKQLIDDIRLFVPTAEPEPQWIPCNMCKHYEGVHEVQGHAPCAFWGIGAVMWHDACKRAEPWRGEEHGTTL